MTEGSPQFPVAAILQKVVELDLCCVRKVITLSCLEKRLQEEEDLPRDRFLFFSLA